MSQQIWDTQAETQPSGFRLQGAFPDGHDMPAHGQEVGFVTVVTGFVAFDLNLPPGGPGFR